ncbi:FAST kinase domain-containing protein 5, mitochondrial [Arctopsyche grandis]|uniref:FAST kinase domain-containing protein 5, mitochondrial n=1 Tax=Arctopsyche grandis TaxID=121162 RepID=UPI00406D7B72
MFLSKSIPFCISVIPRLLKRSGFKTIPPNVFQLSKGHYLRFLSTSPVLQHKLYKENENSHAYSIMKKRADSYQLAKKFEPSTSAMSHERYESILNYDWGRSTPEDLISSFEALSNYAFHYNIGIDLEIFDGFVDALTDNMKVMSDKQLESVCGNFLKWPETASVKTRNFVEIWAALDDVLINRLIDWDVNTSLLFADYMHKLNLSRRCDYTWKVTNKIIRVAKKLSTEQLVQSMYYIAASRKSSKFMYSFELAFENQFNDLTIDEIGVVSIGFFKSKAPLRNLLFVDTLINRVADEASNVTDISLCGILKIIRYSAKIQNIAAINRLQDALGPRINDLSLLCCVHVALVGTPVNIFHPQSLTTIAQKFVKESNKARMKDLERLAFTFAEFNFNPGTTPPVFDTIINELDRSEREFEIKMHPRCLVKCLSFLAMLHIFPLHLIDKVLDEKFLKSAYEQYPHFRNSGISHEESFREILLLSNSVQIECKYYNGNLASENACRDLTKKLTDYLPEPGSKYPIKSSFDKVCSEVLLLLRKMRGGENFVHGDHVLPHFQKGDLIICNNANDQPVMVTDYFRAQKVGSVKMAPDSKMKWFAFVFVGRYVTISNTRRYLGPTVMKVRQLQKIGYRPLVITWQAWNNLKTEDEKTIYLNNLIKQNSSEDELHLSLQQ